MKSAILINEARIIFSPFYEKEVAEMKEKGYFTGSVYYGWIGDRYMAFESESAYLDYIRESN